MLCKSSELGKAAAYSGVKQIRKSISRKKKRAQVHSGAAAYNGVKQIRKSISRKKKRDQIHSDISAYNEVKKLKEKAGAGKFWQDESRISAAGFYLEHKIRQSELSGGKYEIYN